MQILLLKHTANMHSHSLNMLLILHILTT